MLGADREDGVDRNGLVALNEPAVSEDRLALAVQRGVAVEVERRRAVSLGLTGDQQRRPGRRAHGAVDADGLVGRDGHLATERQVLKHHALAGRDGESAVSEGFESSAGDEGVLLAVSVRVVVCGEADGAAIFGPDGAARVIPLPGDLQRGAVACDEKAVIGAARPAVDAKYGRVVGVGADLGMVGQVRLAAVGHRVGHTDVARTMYVLLRSDGRVAVVAEEVQTA